MCSLKSYIAQLVTMAHSKLAFFDSHLVTSRKKHELSGKFQWIKFKCLNPAQPFQKDSLLLTTKTLGVPSNLLIDLAMKLSSRKTEIIQS